MILYHIFRTTTLLLCYCVSPNLLAEAYLRFEYVDMFIDTLVMFDSTEESTAFKLVTIGSISDGDIESATLSAVIPVNQKCYYQSSPKFVDNESSGIDSLSITPLVKRIQALG